MDFSAGMGAPFALDTLLHDHQKQVRDKCNPDLYLDGICAFSIEVP